MKMTSKLQMAIIGCGASTPGKGGEHSIGYAHAWACNACKATKLVAVADIVKKNADDFITEFPGTKEFTDYNIMLKEVCPDIVSICALPQDHEAMVIAALEAGVKGVWIEKPFALSLGAAKRMMAAAEIHKARLFVNHQRRYGKPFEWLSRAAQDGSIGDVISFDIVQPFGCFISFGSHLVDAALFCLGNRRAKYVLAAVDMSKPGEYMGIKTETQLIATIHFADGVRLTIEIGEKACSKLPVLRLNGTQGFAELHLSPASNDKSIFHARFVGQPNMTNPETDEHFHHSSDDPVLYMKRAMEDIAAALTRGTATRIDADEAYRNTEIIMAIYESARLNQIISLSLE
jgi:predicted dehydrogenase